MLVISQVHFHILVRSHLAHQVDYRRASWWLHPEVVHWFDLLYLKDHKCAKNRLWVQQFHLLFSLVSQLFVGILAVSWILKLVVIEISLQAVGLLEDGHRAIVNLDALPRVVLVKVVYVLSSISLAQIIDSNELQLWSCKLRFSHVEQSELIIEIVDATFGLRVDL